MGTWNIGIPFRGHLWPGLEVKDLMTSGQSLVDLCSASRRTEFRQSVGELEDSIQVRYMHMYC